MDSTKQQPGASLPGGPVSPDADGRSGRPAVPGLGASPYALQLRLGHRRLRFPAELEAQYRADQLEPRRRFLMVWCAFIGLLGLWSSAPIDPAILSDLAPLLMPVRITATVVCLIGMAALLLLPVHLRRAWQAEVASAAGALLIAGVICWACGASRTVGAAVHAIGVAMVITYVGAVARLAFRQALLVSVLSLVGFVVWLMPGITPLHQAILLSNAKILAFTVGLTLVANYSFEYAARRAWLLRRNAAWQRAALHRAGERLRELSLRDPLTNLPNRRHFEAAFQTEWDAARAQHGSLALLVLDVDEFKAFNDRCGHPAGDACLQRLADLLAEQAGRWHGLAARLGGEEFALLLPGCELETAQARADTLREAVQALALPHPASPVAAVVTVSVGVAAAAPTGGDGRYALMSQADAGLYRAKQQGRNRVGLPVAAPCGEARAAEARRAAAAAGPVHGAAAAWGRAAADAGTAGGEGSASLSADFLRDPGTVPDDDGSAAGAVPGLPGTGLNRHLMLLRFPRALEAAFIAWRLQPQQQALFGTRNRHLFVVALFGLAMYALYAWTNQEMVSDLGRLPLMMTLACTAGLGVLAGLLLLPLRPWITESLYAAGTTALMLVSLLGISASREFTAFPACMALYLLPLFGAVVARQPFIYVALPSVLTMVAYYALMEVRTPLEHLVRDDVARMLGNALAFTLITAYALDYDDRKTFLLARADERQRRALAESAETLRHLSEHDPLTGLLNRRRFDEELARCWSESQAMDRPVSMLVVDVDHFKLYNDAYGHPAGDTALQRVAALLDAAARREEGLAVRLGGEEFGLLLPDADAPVARRVADGLCADVRAQGLAHAQSPVRPVLTVSIGVATLWPRAPVLTQARPYELLSRADAGLYHAKAAGRDRVGEADPVNAGNAANPADPAIPATGAGPAGVSAGASPATAPATYPAASPAASPVEAAAADAAAGADAAAEADRSASDPAPTDFDVSGVAVV